MPTQQWSNMSRARKGCGWGELVEEGKQVAVVVIDFVYVVTYVRDVCVGWGRWRSGSGRCQGSDICISVTKSEYHLREGGLGWRISTGWVAILWFLHRQVWRDCCLPVSDQKKCKCVAVIKSSQGEERIVFPFVPVVLLCLSFWYLNTHILPSTFYLCILLSWQDFCIIELLSDENRESFLSLEMRHRHWLNSGDASIIASFLSSFIL